MFNPFLEKQEGNEEDRRLIQNSLNGSRADLERLILRHQAWIYNIVIRMAMDPDDAQDITQEVLIKMITNLKSYESGKGSFRTWLYRIVANHVINMKKQRYEQRISDINDYFLYIDKIPDNRFFFHPEMNLLVEECRLSCLAGMLLCFNRKERLVFILGVIFNVSDAIGSEILEVTRSNFRMILSRARRKLYNFMNEKCGVLNNRGPCMCTNKIEALLKQRFLDVAEITYARDSTELIKEKLKVKINDFKKSRYSRFEEIFREQPFYEPADFTKWLKNLIESDDIKEIFNLN